MSGQSATLASSAVSALLEPHLLISKPRPARPWRALKRAAIVVSCAVTASWPTAAPAAAPTAPTQSAAEFSLSVEGPAEPIIADWPFTLTSSWTTDAPRRLYVSLIPGSSCEQSVQAGLKGDRPGILVV